MKLRHRLIACLLSICMILPTLAFTSSATGTSVTGDPVSGFTITNQDGTTQNVDESWVDLYPYGIFALGNSELVVSEGGEQQVLSIYRMGGTTNKASAVIHYQPAVVKNEDGSFGYSQAISANDITIMVEDSKPITQYQPWGEPAAAERTDIKIKSTQGVDGEGISCPILSLDTDEEGIESYQWYSLLDGDWEKVNYAEGPELPVGQEDLDTYDFRCIFKIEGTSYCTDSFKGVPYEKQEAEVLPEAPADIELNPEPTFTELVLDENNNKYNGILFEVSFANGEYKKDIIISAKDDSEAELDEYAAVTISGCVGGEVHQALNTLMLRVADNDDENAEPSQVSFSSESISFDKSLGKAVLTVKRTGGLSKAISVDWSLEDGLAKAGTDYVTDSGTLYFYGDQDEQIIEIQLINDKTLDLNEKEFTVRLSNLLGDDKSSISMETCIVGLYNTNTADDLNLVSTLYDVEAVDVSSGISEAQGAPMRANTITGSQVTNNEGLDIMSASAKSYVDWGSNSGDLDPLIYKYGKVIFNGGNWNRYNTYNMSLNSKGGDSTKKQIPNMSKLYTGLSATVYGGAGLASAWDRIWYGDKEYGYTAFSTGYYVGSALKVVSRWDCSPNFWKSGAYIYLSAYNPFYASSSWGYTDQLDNLILSVDTYESRKAADSISASADVRFTRRNYSNDFYLDIYTANDQDITNSNVSKYTTDNYNGIIQKVEITEGGTYSGKLYEGSTVRVVLGNTHLKPSAATIIDSSGNVMLNGSISGNTATFNNIILPPDGTYTFRLVLDRTQNIKVNVTTSSEVDASGNPVGGANNANEAAYNLLLSKNTEGGVITIGYTPKTGNGLFSGTEILTKSIPLQGSGGSLSLADGIYTTSAESNIQNINFNLSEEDVILFNGKAYAGNSVIWLEPKDLTPKDLMFYFYEENYLTAERPMKVTLDATALYFDTDGNGRIDGYYDEFSGVFIPENGDAFISYMDDIDYEETIFRPVVGDDGKVHQYFLRPYYTANPVCLVVPKGGNESERMQIMPNFITDVTNSSVYEALTDEQKQYRTIVSGKSKFKASGSTTPQEIGHTADNKYKYTAAASAYSYVDIPLGGDKNPARAVTSADLGAPQNGSFTKNNINYMLKDGLAYYYSATAPSNLGNAVYTWEPDYAGNLLYEFDNPRPIYIANSIAGNRIAITNDLTKWYRKTDGTWTSVAPTEDGEGYSKNDMGIYITETRANEDGRDALNSYLGSFGGNDTFALIVNEQSMETDEIINNLGLLSSNTKVSETVTRAILGSFPDSSYLKQNSGNGSDSEGDSKGKGDMEEFSTDVNSELFSFSSEALSLLSVETDGYEISFSLGIPVYSKDNGGGTGSSANTLDDTKEAAGKVKDFIKAIKNPAAGDKKKDAFKKLAGEDLDANKLKSKSVEFSVTVSLGITLKYNPLDNTYKFAEAAIVVAAEIELRLQYRFTPLPIIYVYAQFGLGVSLGVGLGQDRVPVYGETVLPVGFLNEVILHEAPGTGQNRQFYFTTDQKAFGMTFSGKLYMECFEFTDNDHNGIYNTGDLLGQTLPGFNAGYISSDGKEETEIVLKGQDKFELDKPVVVVFTVMDDNNPNNNAEVKITSIKLISGVEQDFYFDGFKLEIEGSIELGAGIGVEIAKVEIFAKVSLGVAFTIVSYEGDGEYAAASIDEFSLAGGIGFRVVLLFFNYEMDFIEYHLNYDGESKEWTHGWSAIGGMFGGDKALGIEDNGGDGKIHVYITPPSQVKARVYDNNVTYKNGDMEDMAYTSNTDDFQVSGYGSSVNAYKLVDNVKTGYDYKIVTVGNNNYVVYTGTRDIDGVDNTQLVLSRLIQTEDASGKDVYGFVNPISGNSTSDIKAIPVDNDAAGDLDFYTWADGNDIHVIWVSYKDETTPSVEPGGTPYSVGGTTMDENNYQTIGKPSGGEYDSESGSFEAAGSSLVINGTTLTQYNYDSVLMDVVSPVSYPTQSDYYTQDIPDPMEGWISEDDEDEVTYYFPEEYEYLAVAKEAYREAREEYNKYQAYSDAKACYDEWLQYYEWYNYFRKLDVQNRVVDASRNTVVKHAVFDTTATDAGTTFEEYAILSDISSETYYFLPQAVGDAAVFAQSVPYTDSELNEQLGKYEAYLNATMTGAGSDNKETSQEYLEASKSYRMTYQQSLMSIYGGNSRLTVSKPDGTPYANGVMYVSKHQEDGIGDAVYQPHEILTNIQMTQIGGTYYLAYVTQQDTFIKNGDIYEDMSSISRLYLRTFTIEADEVIWSDPYLLRTIVNNEQNSAGDGVYDSSLTKTKGYIDPYIANLSFLNGALGNKLNGADEEEFEIFGAVPNETFLLFEMNGNTYVINQASLVSITTTMRGTIYPFFTYEQQYGDALEEDTNQNLSSGKSEVVIGADGDGNIAAIYTASVPNTVNNAIYISYWDPEAAAWSNGVMLAMNYMDVYESSLAEAWDAQTTEAAYLDSTLGGGMTSFNFSNLQIALGRKKADSDGLGGLGALGAENTVEALSASSVFSGFISELGLPVDSEGLEALGYSYSKAELYALAEQAELRGFDTGSSTAAASELLILTQGLQQELAEYESESGKTIIAPKRDSEGMPTSGNLGIYAISYGKGNQQVGNASIRFSYNEFTVGSQLHAIVNFKNVGDAAIRGSVNQPVTVKLMLFDNDGNSTTEMAKWEIKDMIGAGQTVSLSTSKSPCKPLVSNLGTGDYFYIIVSEDTEYTSGGTYIYDSSSDINSNTFYTFNIQNKPEMGIERLKTSVVGVEDDGDAIADLSFDVTNRGNLEAEEVFVQFSYVTGYDENGNAIYEPLDLTDSNLYVSQQKLITDSLDTLGVDDLSKGVIYLGTDSTFYTDDYYITADKYNSILDEYYILDNGYTVPPVSGWIKGEYGGEYYWYNKLYHISAYAAYSAGQDAVKGWVLDSATGNYYNSIYASLSDAEDASDEARKAEYIITTAAYNALPIAQKDIWKVSDAEGYYILKAYGSFAEAEAAYQYALNDNTQNIISNYCRTIMGTVNVSPEKFKGNVTGSLNIQVEVFSKSSSAGLNGSGLYSSSHKDEYYSENNTATAQIEHKSFISVSPKITLAKGSTHRIPVSIRTTTGRIPEIRVVEVADGADEISTLYYLADTDKDGVASTTTGAIIIVGNNEGSGVIHVIDSVTNTTYPIAYRVAEAGEGINIFNDDAQFTFYNKNGALFNENELNQSWKFQILTEWTSMLVSPYLRDIAIGEKDAYFTFETKASKVSFDMVGSATVTSNKFPGTFTISNEGTINPPTTNVIDFGNDSSVSHTVTVKVTSNSAYFDTVRLVYGEDYEPNDDTSAPGIYWSRSFPTGGSVINGETLEFTVYAIDDSGLQSFTFNNTSLPASEIVKTTDGLWSYTFNVTGYDSFTVSATDTNGNTTSRRVDVDWFKEIPDDERYGQKPSLSDATAYKTDEDGNDKKDIIADRTVVMTSADISAGNKILLSAETDEGCNLSYYYYDSSDTKTFREMTSYEGEPSALVTRNGYYMIMSDNNTYNTWSAKILFIDCFEAAPEISISEQMLASPNGYRFTWVATKDEQSTAKLESISLNGINLSSGMPSGATSYSGSNTMFYGGLYEYRVEDTKGVIGINKVWNGYLKVPVDISDSEAISYVNPWAQPVNSVVGHGTITVDFSKITGGDYTEISAAGAASLAEYRGQYEAIVFSEAEYADKLLPGAESSLVDGDDSWLTDAGLTWANSNAGQSHTWDNLEVIEDGESKYLVIIRDAQKPKAYSTMAYHEITLTDNSIDCVSLSTRLASSSTASDGEVYVTAAKGDTGSYEFAILPLIIDAENSTSTNTVYKSRTADEFKDSSVIWQLSDWNSATFSDAALVGLTPGWYQVAIRSFLTGDRNEMQSLTELNALGIAPDSAARAVETIENNIVTNVTTMTNNISTKSNEWRTASENAATLNVAYDDLFRRLERGDTTVTSSDVDEAYNSWQEALTDEANARTDYLNAFTDASNEQKDNFEALRSGWLSSVTYEEKNAARNVYEKAVYDYCLEYCTSQVSAELADAREVFNNAKKAYDDQAEILTGLSATEYEGDTGLWDGLLTGEALQVTVSSGTGTSIKASPVSTSQTSATGRINVTAFGGSAYDGGNKVNYQFALLPIEDEAAAVDYSSNMADISNLGLEWQFADNLASAHQEKAFTNLTAGWYQVFVRAVYDNDLRDGYDVNTNLYDSTGIVSDLSGLRKDYEDAVAASDTKAVEAQASSAHELFLKYQKSNSPADQEAYLTAIDNDATVTEALDDWLNAVDSGIKKTAYETYRLALFNHYNEIADTELREANLAYSLKLAELRSYIEKVYSKAPGNYDTASFTKVYVGIASSGAGYLGGAFGNDGVNYGDGEVEYRLNEGSKLLPAESRQILNDNSTLETHLFIGSRHVVIPAGMLRNEDEVSDILNNFTGGIGNVVEYTDADGNTRIIPISMTQDGEVAYMYSGAGTYRLVPGNAPSFSDINNHWANESVAFVTGKGLFNGVSENRFAPNKTMTRAMLATVLYRLIGQPDTGNAKNFGDVADDTWYTDAVMWAYNNGIASGVGENLFAPDKAITRADMVTMLYRFSNAYGFSAKEISGLDKYTDGNKVPSYAQEAFEWAIAAGIISGNSKGQLSPLSNATRAEVATVFERMIRYILK